MTSKCGKNTKVAHKPLGRCVTMFLSRFDVFLCDLSLDRRRATWNLLVLYDKEVQVIGHYFDRIHPLSMGL